MTKKKACPKCGSPAIWDTPKGLTWCADCRHSWGYPEDELVQNEKPKEEEEKP